MRRRGEKKELVVILNDGKAGPRLKDWDVGAFAPQQRPEEEFYYKYIPDLDASAFALHAIHRSIESVKWHDAHTFQQRGSL
jgi:hypothetical protein